MKTIKLFAMAAVGALLALSCTSELEDSLAVASTELSVSNEGGELPLNFTTNTSWTIVCDQTWVSFDYVSGEAGENTVVATVEANDTYEDREAVITIAAGSKTTVFTVKQSYSVEFTSEVVYNVSFEAQTIEYNVLTNAEVEVTIAEECREWISIAENVDAKAAPVESKLSFAVTENGGFAPRTGYIYVSAANVVTRLVVKQGPAGEFVFTVAPEVMFLGRSMDVYNGGVLSYGEYALTFDTNDGFVRLALNYETPATPLAGVPAGEFAVDSKGKHAAGTFSVKKSDNSERYYTTIMFGDEERVVVDGEISVSVAENVYTINAALVDIAGESYLYKYVGELGAIEDNSKGGDISSLTYKNTFNTFFTSKSNNWVVTLYFANQPAVFEGTSVNRIELNLYGPTGEVTEKSVLPTGVFTLVEDKNVEGKSGNGLKDAQPGNFTLSKGNLGCVNFQEYIGVPIMTEANTVEITKNDDGTYNFKFNITYNLTLKNGDPFRSNVVLTEEYENISLAVTASDNQIYPIDEPKNGDVLTITSAASTYMVYDYGDVFNVGGSVAVMDFGVYGGIAPCGGALPLYLALQMTEAYVHDGGMFGVYSTAAIPAGEYVWAAAPVAGQKSILPLRIGTDKKSECYVKNYMTGNKWNIIGGKVTVGSEITLDLTASNGLDGEEKVEFQIKGSCPISIQYGSSQGGSLSLAE